MITNLANKIYCCSTWDPENLRSPAQPITTVPQTLLENVAFQSAMPLVVFVPVTVTAHTNGFINNLIQVFLDTPENLK
jgi:hypothetical protein